MDNPIYLTEYPNMNTKFPYSLKFELVDTVVPHRHDFLELILVLEGEGVQIVNGNKHRLTSGSFIFLLPYQFHEIQITSEQQLILFICNFDLELLLQFDDDEQGLASMVFESGEELPPFVQLDNDQLKQMNSIFNQMMLDYVSSESMKNSYLKAKLMEALILFHRYRLKQHKPSPAEAEAQKRRGDLWKVIRYVHLNYREDLSLEHLAQVFHYNVSHLSDLFKKRFGQNFTSFLQSLRIRHACGLLLSTNLSVLDIAYEVGFGSFQTFSRAFRKIKGFSPTVYRATMKPGSATSAGE